MSQVTKRRIGLALGFWGLLRNRTRLCRWFPSINPRHDRAGISDRVRWVGDVRIGTRSHHALLSPPPAGVTYSLLADPHSRMEAWCGVLRGAGVGKPGSVEFAIRVRVEGGARSITRSLRIPFDQSARGNRWRRLVLELRNATPQRIQVK